MRVNPLLEDLVPGFLENLRRALASATTALHEGDYDAIRVTGHKMKGAGGGYGFDAITEIGSALEQAGRHKHDAEIRKRVEELHDYLDRVEVVFEEG